MAASPFLIVPTRLAVSGYVIKSQLQASLYGAVHLATNGKGEDVVIKSSCYPTKARDETKKCPEDPRTEARILKHIMDQGGHPNIIPLLHSFDERPDEGKLFSTLHLVLKYCPGGELYAVLFKRPDLFSESNVARFFGQMASAVEFLHSHGIAHLDLSPENWLFDASREHLLLCDFGMACKLLLPSSCSALSSVRVNTPPTPTTAPTAAGSGSDAAAAAAVEETAPEVVVADDAASTSTTTTTTTTTTDKPPRRLLSYKCARGCPGKKAYQAPEIVEIASRPRQEVCYFDAYAADVWSCGVLLFIMLTRTPPWELASSLDSRYRALHDPTSHSADMLLRKWHRALPPQVKDLLKHMWDPVPARRWTMQQVLEHEYVKGRLLRASPLVE